MIEPSAIIAEARSWLGTVFHHQAAIKGVGCDCVGLITGTGAAFGWQPDPQQFKRFRNYAKLPNPGRMLEALNLFLVPVDGPPALADILYLQWRTDLPTHLAIFADLDGRPTIIHALSEAGIVIEHGYVDPWPGRLHSVWRYPFATKG